MRLSGGPSDRQVSLYEHFPGECPVVPTALQWLRLMYHPAFYADVIFWFFSSLVSGLAAMKRLQSAGTAATSPTRYCAGLAAAPVRSGDFSSAPPLPRRERGVLIRRACGSDPLQKTYRQAASRSIPFFTCRNTSNCHHAQCTSHRHAATGCPPGTLRSHVPELPEEQACLSM